MSFIIGKKCEGVCDTDLCRCLSSRLYVVRQLKTIIDGQRSSEYEQG